MLSVYRLLFHSSLLPWGQPGQAPGIPKVSTPLLSSVLRVKHCTDDIMALHMAQRSCVYRSQRELCLEAHQHIIFGSSDRRDNVLRCQRRIVSNCYNPATVLTQEAIHLQCLSYTGQRSHSVGLGGVGGLGGCLGPQSTWKE